MYKYKKLKYIYLTALLFLALAFLTTSVGRNVGNFVPAQQAELLGGIKYIDYSYNLRGIGYKLFAYYLHTMSTFFSDFKNKILYEFFIKLNYLSIILCASIVFSYGYYLLNKKNKNIFFFSFFTFLIIFLNSSHRLSLEPEEVSSLLTLVAIGLFFYKRKIFQILSGFLLAITFSIKGITAIHGIAGLILIFFFIKNISKDIKKIKIVILGYILGLIFVFAYLTLLKYEFQDLTNAISVQNITYSDLIIRSKIFILKGIGGVFRHSLLLTISSFIFIWIILNEFKKKKYFNSVILTSTLILVFFVSFFQGSGRPYHLAGLQIISLVSWLTLYNVLKNKNILFIIMILISIEQIIRVNFDPFNLIKGDLTNKEQREYRLISQKKYDEFVKKYKLNNQESILYLDDSRSSYHLGNKGYSRYYIATILGGKNEEINKKYVREVLNYKGEYVFIDFDWLPNSKYTPEIVFFVKNNYYFIEKINSTSIYKKINR